MYSCTPDSLPVKKLVCVLGWFLNPLSSAVFLVHISLLFFLCMYACIYACMFMWFSVLCLDVYTGYACTCGYVCVFVCVCVSRWICSAFNNESPEEIRCLLLCIHAKFLYYRLYTCLFLLGFST